MLFWFNQSRVEKRVAFFKKECVDELALPSATWCPQNVLDYKSHQPQLPHSDLEEVFVFSGKCIDKVGRCLLEVLQKLSEDAKGGCKRGKGLAGCHCRK